MSKVLVTEQHLQDIADAIRSKSGGGGTTLKVSDMAQAIEDIPSGDGEWATDGIASNSEPNGAITITSAVAQIYMRAFSNKEGITEVTLEGSPYISNYAFDGCKGITKLNAPNLQRIYSSDFNASSFVFNGCTALRQVCFPKYGDYAVGTYAFQGCTSLTVADLGRCNNIQNAFIGCSALRTLILRRTNNAARASVGGSQGFAGIYNNPMDSAIYVPSALIPTYQSATNWAALYALNPDIFKPIEGSYYETHYADGTEIAS